MNALLPLWRVMAWVGGWWRSLKAGERKGRLRWQDKSGASRWGVGAQNYEPSKASRLTPRLAPFREIDAFPPCNEPAANHLPLQP
jgi:hypothetical protein